MQTQETDHKTMMQENLKINEKLIAQLLEEKEVAIKELE